MKWSWLRRSGSDHLIVVFGGWALGSAPFRHLDGPQDVLLAEDYRNLDAALPAEAESYDRRDLIAFSFGVAAFGHWRAQQGESFARRVAVNGTLAPVDRRTGIPPVVMQKTTDTMSVETFQGFLARCHDIPQPDTRIDVAARKDELECVASRGPAPDTRFDRIWISGNDRIFPPANQCRAWAAQVDGIRRIDAPHVPFHRWENWSEVLA